ncbi:MAG: LPS-assembly protein LptD [Rhodothermales bacterium]|nr:LPS-assembly protein LptD [Rhodothermales bacterium]MBO6779836.1 LPS-assembly protein LptD [Rhodothermales bacterium]
MSGPIQFVASDSLIVRFGETDLGSLFGSANVVYDQVQLNAWRIDMLFDIEEVRAEGLETDTGTVGLPQFTQDTETFIGKQLAFNLRTERGRVVEAQTQIQEGFVRADVVKATEDSTLFIRNGAYTTCPCVEDPSYSLRSNKMKIVNQKWIYTGPIQLFLFNIPTPLWLPFGFLPAQESRRSGPLPPTYGEDQFGFYLKDWGWYFAMNDYMDLQLQGSVWTRGSVEGSSLFRYARRYGFSGQLGVRYGRFPDGIKGDPRFGVTNTTSFRWNHTQTISPTASFDANVNLSSRSFLQGVSESYNDKVTQNIQSSMRYSKRWRARSLTVNTNHNQTVSTGAVTLGVPSVSFSQSSFKPFARSNRPPGSGERFYEKVTLSYSMSADNRFSFQPLADELLISAGDSAAIGIDWIDALLSQEDFVRATGQDERFAFKATHRIPVSAPFSVASLPLLGDFRMNLSPSLSYTEDWFVRTKRLVPDSTGALKTESVPGFFALRQYTASLSASSVFYGLFPVNVGPYRGVRHTVRPSLGFGYRPDFFDDRFGYTRTYTDAAGNEIPYAIVSGVSPGEQQALSFSIANTFETKRAAPDSVAAPGRAQPAIKLFDLNVASSYNLAADSLGFGNISLTGRTRLFGEVDVDFRSNFSPYRVDTIGALRNEYAFSTRTPLGRMTSASLTVRTSIRSQTTRGESRPLTTPRAGFAADPALSANPLSATIQQPFGGPVTDFAIPWSLSMDFTYGVNRTGLLSTKRAVVNANFDFSLTPNWKVSGRGGYDLERGQLSTTSLAVARDFDCWQMSFNWIPTGIYQSWGFDLHVKSSHLRDLLRVRQPKSDVRDRFGGL